MDHAIQESELETHIQSWPIHLQAGKEEALIQLRTRWTSSEATLRQRAEDVKMIASEPESLKEALCDLEALQVYEAVLKQHTDSETSKTAEGQIFFQGSATRVLNHIPFLVTLFVYLKVYVSPILALFSPLLLLVAPYIILKTVMDTDMPWDIYVSMMKRMIFGVEGSEPWRLKHYAQVAWTIGSMGQSIITPFFTAYHTNQLDIKILERGEALIKIASTIRRILDSWKQKGSAKSWTLKVPDVPTEPRQAVAWITDEPSGYRALKRCAGYVALTAFQASTAWSAVQWSKRGLQLTNLYDLALAEKNPVNSSLNLDTHSLVTGPNRGGKSSALRAVLQQVLLGQTFGMTYYARGSWRPFQHLFTRLKSKDHAGRESLFEMEVRMAATMLKTARATGKHSLLLIDELFHSTNPPDAEISAKLFLQQLWALPNVKSVVSTHIFSLCEISSGPQTFCVPADELDNGTIQYSYKLVPGICKVSSVREVLQEYGLDTNSRNGKSV